jgi:hypothetical protein
MGDLMELLVIMVNVIRSPRTMIDSRCILVDGLRGNKIQVGTGQSCCQAVGVKSTLKNVDYSHRVSKSASHKSKSSQSLQSKTRNQVVRWSTPTGLLC